MDTHDHDHPTCDKYGRKILTVGQLRELIAGLDDQTHVVIDNTSMRGTTDGWFTNVATVGLPDDDMYVYMAVTLYGGAECSSNQW